MTITTEQRFRSAVNADLWPQTLPVAIGSVDHVARAHLVGMYTGLWENVPESNIGVDVVSSYGVNIATEVLYVWNSNSNWATDSAEVRDYYLENRPGMGGSVTPTCQVEAIDFTTGTGSFFDVTSTHWTTDLRPQFAAILEANTSIKYVVLGYGCPRQITGIDRTGVAYLITRAVADEGGEDGTEYYAASGVVTQARPYIKTRYPGTACLPCHMDTGSVASTKAYIDKLKTKHAAMDKPHVIICGNDDNPNGDYWFSDYRPGLTGAPVSDKVTFSKSGVRAANIRAKINYSNAALWPTPSRIAGIQHWGQYGFSPVNGEYAEDGSYVHDGDWYLIGAFESFTGIPSSDHTQGAYDEWFGAAAFGGTSYSATPACAMTTSDEPTTDGVPSYTMFQAWELGMPFGEVAWAGRKIGTSFAKAISPVGDPLIGLWQRTSLPRVSRLVEALKARLLATTGVTDIIGAEIDTQVAWRHATLPRIVLRRDNTSRSMHMRGEAGQAFATYLVACYADSYSGAKELATAVRGSLDSWRDASADTVPILSSVTENESDSVFDNPRDQTQRVYGVLMSVDVWHRETKAKGV